MKYVVHCYFQILLDHKRYNFSKRGKLKPEDFLRNGLVDDYLSRKQYKDYYKNSISDNPCVEIYFQKEENQVYSSGEGLADDYIDISIKETKLSDILSGETSDEIRFAIECKRIKEMKDCTEYVKDIQKLADRQFKSYRLPYEGQIAFIEDENLDVSKVSTGLNERLKDTPTINTTHYLKKIALHEKFIGSYLSSHKRNYSDKADFSIYHLLFDYSQVISSD